MFNHLFNTTDAAKTTKTVDPVIVGAKTKPSLWRDFKGALAEMRHADMSLLSRNTEFPAVPPSCIPALFSETPGPTKAQMLHAVHTFNIGTEPSTFILSKACNAIGATLTRFKNRMIAHAKKADEAYEESWKQKHGH